MFFPNWLRARSQRYYRRIETVWETINTSRSHLLELHRQVINTIKKFYASIGKIEIDEDCKMGYLDTPDSNKYNTIFQKIGDSDVDVYSLLEETKRKLSVSLNILRAKRFTETTNEKTILNSSYSLKDQFVKTMPVTIKNAKKFSIKIDKLISGKDSDKISEEDQYFGMQYGCIGKNKASAPRLDFSHIFPSDYYNYEKALSDSDPRSFMEFEVVVLEPHENFDKDAKYTYTQSTKEVNSLDVKLILSCFFQSATLVNSIAIHCTGKIIKIEGVDFSGNLIDLGVNQRSETEYVFKRTNLIQLNIVILSNQPQKVSYDMLQLKFKYRDDIIWTDVCGKWITKNYESIAKTFFEHKSKEAAQIGMFLPNDFVTAYKIMRYGVSVGVAQLSRWVNKLVPNYKDIAIPVKIKTYDEHSSHRKRWAIRIDDINVYDEEYATEALIPVYQTKTFDDVHYLQIGITNGYIPKNAIFTYIIGMGNDACYLSDIVGNSMYFEDNMPTGLTAALTTVANNIKSKREDEKYQQPLPITAIINDPMPEEIRTILKDQFAYINTNDPKDVNIALRINTTSKNDSPILSEVQPLIIVRKRNKTIDKEK